MTTATTDTRALLVAALLEIIERAPETEPEYEDWGGDTEDAETWGQSAGLWEAAEIARGALRAAGLDIGAEEARTQSEPAQDDEDADADSFGDWMNERYPETFADLWDEYQRSVEARHG
jgi:hypothetical protein